MSDRHKLLPDDEGGFDGLTALNNNNLEAMANYYEGVTKSMAQLSTEACQFITMRLEEDFELPGKMARCQTPVDAFQTQIAFLEKMASDYVDETVKLHRLMMNGAGLSQTLASGREARKETAEKS